MLVSRRSRMVMLFVGALAVKASRQPRSMRYTHSMIDRDDEDNPIGVTAATLFGSENMFTLYGYCGNCHEIHTDAERVASYLQWLSNQWMISFN